MMNHSFHCHLRRSFRWYHNWHNHPRHQHAHWALFLVVALFLFSLLNQKTRDIYYENEYKAQAAVGPTIELFGDKFNINGSAKFLLFISYFHGMAASGGTLNSDFSALKANGFDGIRILVNWPCNTCPQNPNFKLFDSSGNYRPGMLAQLQTILQDASNNGLVVDLTFTGADTVSGISLVDYQKGLENSTRDLNAYRNTIFDLQNERDFDTGDGRYLTAAQVKTLRDAVKAIDSSRLVTASITGATGPSGVGADTSATNIDFVAYHDPRFGDWPGNTDNEVNAIRGGLGGIIKPIYLQEPERYRGTAPYADSTDDWITAAKNAKCAGAAGWTFHTAAAYDLSDGSSIFTNFNSVENTVVNTLFNQTSGTVWDSCRSSGGGGGGSGITGCYQGPCPAGYIAIGGANASDADPTETAGWFCDDDQGLGTDVTGVTYPITAQLACGGNSSGTAFIADNSWWPCNAGRPGIPGWDFSSGRPFRAGAPVTFRAELSCSSGTTTFTLNDSNFTAGAWTQSPSTEGAICVQGILLPPSDPICGGTSTPTPNPTPITPTPNPTPIPRYIYFIDPGRVVVGETITIVGENLSSTVQFTDLSGNRYTFLGTIDPKLSEVTFTIPPVLAIGTYTVRVGPTLTDISNGIEFEVLSGTYYNPPPPDGPPFIAGFSPTIVARGDTLEMFGSFLTPYVQFFDINGKFILTVGILSDDLQLTTVTIPSILVPGIYTVGITGPSGSATSPDLLTVVEGQPPAPEAAGAISPPPATDFSQLISSVYTYAVMLVGIAVFIMILWGGFLWVTSGANPGNIAKAKSYIFNAILGGILLLSSYVILYTVNPELVGGTFELKGIQTPVPLPEPTPSANCNDPQKLAQEYSTYYPQPRTTAYGGDPALDDLIRCIINHASVTSLVDRNQIYTYERSNNLCNYTRGNPVCGACAHTVNSCHYGGAKTASSGSTGALAVDFNALDGSETGEDRLWDAVNTIVSVCGSTSSRVRFEKTGTTEWHTHVSLPSCSGN